MLGILAAALTVAAGAQATPKLWPVEVRPGSGLASAERLGTLRARGVTAILVRGGKARFRRRAVRTAQRSGLASVVVGRRCRRSLVKRSRCARLARGTRARRVARRGGRRPVVVPLRRVRGVRDVVRWRGKRRAVIARVRLPATRRYRPGHWRQAIRRVRGSRMVSLAVSPPRRRSRRALDRYLDLLSAIGVVRPAPGADRAPPADQRAPGPATPVVPNVLERVPGTGWLPVAPPPFDRPASVFVAPSGNDGGPCSALAPCKSFDRAYRVADPGDVVEVAAGTYPDQHIGSDASKSAGPVVLFRPRAGARVVIATDLEVEGARIEFRDMELVENWYAHEGSHHLTFRNIDAARLMVASASDINVVGGDYGPSVNAVSQIKSATGSTFAPTRILLEGVDVHDYTRSNSSQHMECLHVMAANGVAIRRSRFDDCSIFGISFNHHGDSGPMRGILVENSWFGEVLDGGAYAVHFSDGVPCEATVRFSTFVHSGVSQDCPEHGAGMSVHSNILPRSPAGGADNGYHWDHNVYQRGTQIGPHDRVAAVTFEADGVHLAAGSAAIGRGDPTAFPATDFEGHVRTRPPDAGADQRP